MSNPDTSAGSTPESAAPKPESGGLQFDRAEYSKPKSITCSTCNQPIQSTYYKINGNNVCEPCRDQVEAHISGGSGARRFIRASIFGTVAAAVGSGIYYLVGLTGYQIGLIAILVGYIVGTAVRQGADHRGGWVYQLLAVFLTYSAIASSYAPDVINFLKQQNSNSSLEDEEPEGVSKSTTPKSTASKSEKNSETKTVSSPAPVATKQADTGPVSFIDALIGLCAFIILIYSIPVIMGIQSIIGLLIVGFGLYQAWSINKRIQIEVKGPFNVPPGNQGAQPTGA